MNVYDEHTRSLWMDAEVAKAPALERSEDADVAVVGSGIAGLSCAYELVARGRSVIVLDRGDIGSGMTARTTAHLASALDDDYAKSAQDPRARLRTTALSKPPGVDQSRRGNPNDRVDRLRLRKDQRVLDSGCRYAGLQTR